MILSGKRIGLLSLSVVLLGALISTAFFGNVAFAGSIDPRSLTLEAGTVPGSQPGDGNPAHTVKHLFTFTISSTTTLGSIKFQYCTTPDPATACTTPNGLVTTAATLSNQSGANTGFSLTNTTNGAPFIHRTAANGVAATSSYELSGIQNPDDTNCFGGTLPQSNNCTFYVRITTYSGTDGATGATDTGSVAASTATQIVLSGYMPESLVFCTGASITLNGANIPDCSTATSGAINFGDFSPAVTTTATSQLAASTNANSGYAITVNGPTLTNGSYTIAATGATAQSSNVGSGQFGMNLLANTSPSVGSNINQTSNGTNLKGEAIGQYAITNKFAFQSGDTVADSADGGAGPSDGQLYTASYIVNVSGSQRVGTYTSTLTYICTPTF